jgi:hypothetical protein
MTHTIYSRHLTLPELKAQILHVLKINYEFKLHKIAAAKLPTADTREAVFKIAAEVGISCI